MPTVTTSRRCPGPKRQRRTHGDEESQQKDQQEDGTEEDRPKEDCPKEDHTEEGHSEENRAEENSTEENGRQPAVEEGPQLALTASRAVSSYR